MSDQSDVSISHERSHHSTVTIPPEWSHPLMHPIPPEYMDPLDRERNRQQLHLQASRVLQGDPFSGHFDLHASHLQASRDLQSEHDEDEDEDEDTPSSQTGALLLNDGVPSWNSRTWMQAIHPRDAYLMFSEQLRLEVLNTQVSQASEAFMRGHGYPSVSSIRALPSPRQPYHREHFGMNVDLPVSQAYQRPPGEGYIVIGIISAISFAIYGSLFDVSDQIYKEEDGSFFSHHGVMVTISMVSMMYAAFSAIFLCVIYYLSTADPTNTYRRRMRFLSGTFVYAAFFGPAVMFMAMFVRQLVYKVFAWTVLGAALTLVGFYIGG